jgi:8-oxo-dGTP diphosphatase
MAPDAVRWPRVGVGVLIVRDGKVLIGKRKGSHGAGQYALPGGKLEWMETWEDCARREVLEECAIDLSAVNVGCCYTTEAVIDENNHWITVFMIAKVPSTTEAVNSEPEKCEGWEWMAWDDVPVPRFLPLDNILRDASFTPKGVESRRT